MPGRTDVLLQELGNTHRLTVLAEIVGAGAISHADLLSRVPAMRKADVSKALTQLDQLGLVVRPTSNRGEWRPAAPAESRRFLAAAGALSAFLGRADAAADQAMSDRFADENVAEEGTHNERAAADDDAPSGAPGH